MIVLIRHGQATHHTEHLTGGWTDSLLTDKGKEQMRRVAQSLKMDFANRPMPLLYASDLKRAVMSAEIVGTVLGIPNIDKFAFLREKNNGKAANLTEQEAKKFFHKPPTETALDHVNYDGGETRRQFFNRVVYGMKHLPLTNKDVIIVAHKGTIQNLVFGWLGFAIDRVADRNFSVDIRPASVTVLGVNRWHEHALFMLNGTNYHGKEIAPFGLGDFKED
jgi:broad specificity phosphatase PhoE